jgi:hypothetical protein
MRIPPFVLALCPLFSQGASPEAPAPALAPPPEILAHPAVIGASLSAGFGLQSKENGPLRFVDVIADLVLVTDEKPFDAASPWLFLDPEKKSLRAVEQTLTREPSLLIGIDFLFWFAYGARTSEELHLERFERGLALLERFPCPILVGDLPDMSGALEAPVKMLTPEQVPDPAVLKVLNARLYAWAKDRPRVTVIPLADFVARTLAGQRVEVRGNVWEEAAERMLQPDRLHPSLEGTVCVALLVLDALERASEDVTPEMILWDAEAALERLRP